MAAGLVVPYSRASAVTSSALMPHVARGALRRPRGGTLRQLGEAGRVAVDVVVVDEIVGDQHMHEAERERAVGARQQRDVLVAFFGGRAAVRIDRDQLRAAPFGFLRAHPEMQVRRDRVAAPDQDQPAVLVLLDVHADRRADGGGPAGLAGRRADRAVEQRRAESMEEAAVHRRVLQEPHRAGVAVGKNGLRSGGRRRDGAEARGDRGQRLVPRDALETAFAFAADASHRMQHALVRVRPVEIARDLGAEHAARRRMIRRAANGDRAAVLDCRQQRARVGTVVRASATHDVPAGGRRRIEWHEGTSDSTGLCTTAATAYPSIR